MEEFLEKLKTTGGAIVSSKECSPMEIAVAQAQGNMFVDEDGTGFVLRPQAWLDAIGELVAELAELAELRDA